jgi:hypothetical protein
MPDKKHPLASKTVLAGLSIILISIARLLGVEMTEADTSELSRCVESGVYAALGLWAIYGRFKARAELSLKPARGGSFLGPLIVLTLLMLCVGGCSQAMSTPDQPLRAGEESQGWTDAIYDRPTVTVNVYEGATFSNSQVQLWIDTSTGNAREGKGAEQQGGTVGNTTQTPTTDIKPDIDVHVTPGS